MLRSRKALSKTYKSCRETGREFRHRTFNMIFRTFVLLTTLLSISYTSFAFPNYANRLKRQEAEGSSSSMDEASVAANPPPAPGPPTFTGTKLVHNLFHPWRPPREGDERGPCPGMNTLASHGVGIQLAPFVHFLVANSFGFSSTSPVTASRLHLK
jgi:hypothetical protein